MTPTRSFTAITAGFVVLAATVLTAGCAREPEWKKAGDEIIARENISLRTRTDIPNNVVTPNLVPGMVSSLDTLPAVELSFGVKAKFFWGKGALVSVTTLTPGAALPREELPSDRLMIVMKGSVKQLISGKMFPMADSLTVSPWVSTPHRDFVYMREGSISETVAGDLGAEIIEIFWPVRSDYIQYADGERPAKILTGSYGVTLPYPENKVLDFYDNQFATIDADGAVNARILPGLGFQAAFVSGDPGTATSYQATPEERLALVLRGGIDETINDLNSPMKAGDIVYCPAAMVHRETYSAKGCDLLEISWPPRPDYAERLAERTAAYREIIPEGVSPILEHDGTVQRPLLNFTEGPVWLDGWLYFSNMWFAGDFSAGSPERSNLVRMSDQTIEVVESGMQTNGLMPLGNGNLAVCDMYGHRLIEMTPDGKTVRTLASSYNGVRLDGPNDLVIDAKGGIYFTDPQFTPGLDKQQPGRAVYYRKPDGAVVRVVAPGEIGMPNGVLLSPDGKTCYINNTRGLPVGNHLIAYDVNPDGTLSNGREFGKLFIPPAVLDQKEIITGADGMTIDVEGNIYVATLMGLQIFDKNGSFIGIVHLPIRPVSCAFGGTDMQTIYCTCPSRIYSIRTNMKGLTYPLK